MDYRQKWEMFTYTLKQPSLTNGMRKHSRNPSSQGNLFLKLPQPEKGMCLDKIYSYVPED